MAGTKNFLIGSKILINGQEVAEITGIHGDSIVTSRLPKDTEIEPDSKIEVLMANGTTFMAWQHTPVKEPETDLIEKILDLKKGEQGAK